jgi:very-short-patch-repair endonuclease
MEERIIKKLESSRKELLDFSLRNPLINFKHTKAKGVHIVNEDAGFVFDFLVNQKKTMGFVGQKAELNTKLDFPNSNDLEKSSSNLTDNKLQTNETEIALQKRLLGTFYNANTILEEQGVNTLYLSLGMIEWYEVENSNEVKNAPVILIPVALERITGKDKFKLKYTEEDIGLNISFKAKLKNDFGIEIPNLPDLEDLDVGTYFKKLDKIIKHKDKWKLNLNAIELGFFSFGKFLIYNDLDSNNWPVGKKPFMNALFQGLLGEGNNGPNPGFGDDEFMDNNPFTERLFQVVDADSSQIQSMVSINNGNNQIIQGPPGTGKSQTITNIIANAIGQGQKVLFVAEKMAALEVVKRRLDNLNLGDACLELHSNKANKKDFLNELKRIVELGPPLLAHLEGEVISLKRNRENLNKYSELVNSSIPGSHLNFHQIIGKLLQIKEILGEEKLPNIPTESIKNWGPEKIKIAEDFADRVQLKLNEIGEPTKLLFWGAELTVILPKEEVKIKEELTSVISNLSKLKDFTEEVSTLMGLGLMDNIEESSLLLNHIKLLIVRPDLVTVNIENSSWLNEKDKINKLIVVGKRIDELKAKYDSIFIEEVWKNDWTESRLAIAINVNKWYKFLIGDYNKHKNKLLSFRKAKNGKIKYNYLEILDDLLEAKKLESDFFIFSDLGKELYGKYWSVGLFNWNEMNDVANYLAKIHGEIKLGSVSPKFIQFLTRNEEIESWKTKKETLELKIELTKKEIIRVIESLKFNSALRFGEGSFWLEKFSNLISFFKSWVSDFYEIQKAISWNIIQSNAIEEELEEVSNAVIGWSNSNLYLKEAILKTWLECVFEKVIRQHPALAKFDRVNHEELTKQFVKADQANFQLNIAKVALRHFENLPNLSAGGQMNVLRTEFNKRARHFPIRKLIIEAGNAIQSIKPVFMMSPLSISNFLPPGVVEFDLIVFDEASQIRPVEAFGAILRGKQLVVVGDSKQLPPTSFFDTISNEELDEDNVTSDMESILGLCNAQGIGVPQKMLRWHYRSKHESLIKFSNHKFYENRLVVFPSPETSAKLGLVLHHLPETTYDRGVSRTNKDEAKKVVERLVSHIKNYPKLTIGVVAFSSAQRQVIEDEFELQRSLIPEIEKYEQFHLTEPLFIKNLENVQGDERDIILISIGYGKNKEGFVSMSFGPLNFSGGEKRLNVLVTRAKLKCEVFTNLLSDDINISNSQSEGLIALKEFLYFAQNGRLNLTAETGKSADSFFEEHVANRLRNLGYDVRNQVGSNGFFIDLTVVDIEKPGKYILGIECDGRMYHSARSARDRDRLRQQVLEGMGWKIHRIWSTDWFKNQENEFKRLIEAIEKAKQDNLDLNNNTSQLIDEPIITQKVKRGKPNDANEKIEYYTMAKLNINLNFIELHNQEVDRLASWIEQVVKIESPVHFEEVARRILDAAGISKLGSRIREALMVATKYYKNNNKIIVANDFLYYPAQQNIIVRNRGLLPSSSKKIKYISEEEVLVSLQKIVIDSFGIPKDEAISLLASTFGFLRVTEEIRLEFERHINKAIKKKQIASKGGVLNTISN